MRLAEPTRLWMTGAERPGHAYLHPGQLLRVFARVRQQVLAGGCPAPRSPFPDDLRAPLLAAGAEPAIAPPAAEHGRDAR